MQENGAWLFVDFAFLLRYFCISVNMMAPPAIWPPL
jgi:hypothetical protein